MKDSLIIEHILNGWHLNDAEVKRAKELSRIIDLYLKQIKK